MPESRQARIEADLAKEVEARLVGDKERNSRYEFAASIVAAYEAVGHPLVSCQGELRAYDPTTGCFDILPKRELERFILRCRIGLSDRTNSAAKEIGETIRTLAHREEAFFTERPRAICLANGVLNLRTEQLPSGRLLPRVEFDPEFSPDYRCTEQLSIGWDVKADTLPAKAFFEGVLPDDGTTEMILRLIGLALLGDGAKLSRILILHGEGANGKGVLSDFLSALFHPSTVTSVPPSMLVNDYGKVGLLRSRLNVVSELDTLSPREHTALKEVTTGEPISVRYVGGNVFKMRPQSQFLIATNNLPDLGSRSAANLRRFVLVQMSRVIPPEERDPMLKGFLRRVGLPGLLLMCVDAANRAYELISQHKDGLEIPESVQRANGALYRTEGTIDDFTRRLVRTGDSRDRISASTVYEAYREFADEAGSRVVSSAVFKLGLETRGFRQVTSDGRKWAGVKWAEGPEASEGPKG